MAMHALDVVQRYWTLEASAATVRGTLSATGPLDVDVTVLRLRR